MKKSIRIERPPKDVWDCVSDPETFRQFFVGITKWEPIGDASGDVGDHYWILMRVGSIEAGGRIRLTEVTPPSRFAWTAEAGTQHDLSIWIEPAGDTASLVTIEFQMELVGGVMSRLAEVVAGRSVARNVRASLQVLRHLVEFGHPNDFA